jgi:hypothetical protein
MLGMYKNFPSTIHGATRFTHAGSVKKTQRALVAILDDLNQATCNLETITGSPGEALCEVNFEVGVGEEITFTFLEPNEVERLNQEISRKVLPVLDFHVVKGSRRRSPLKFDYFLLRFIFTRNLTEFLVVHERGTRRVHVDDLAQFLIGRVEKRLEEDRRVDSRIGHRRGA